MSDNQENLNGSDNKKKKKGPRFLRHREKYSNDIDGFSVTDKSPIRNGMVKERQCTDMFCAIVLVICAIGFFGVAGWSLSTGSLENIVRGVDGDFNVCGQPANVGNGTIQSDTRKFPFLLVVSYNTFESASPLLTY